EHPVTEEITGVDLVEWQLRVASGEPLPKTQDELAINGWAMEARLYAEDPATGFLPSTGKLDHVRLPAGVRIETGVGEGDAISNTRSPRRSRASTSSNGSCAWRAGSRCRRRRTSSQSTAGRWKRGFTPRTPPRASSPARANSIT